MSEPAHEPASPPPTPLQVVRGDRKPLQVDLDESPLPAWLADWETFRATAAVVRKRWTRRARNLAVLLPGALWWLAVVYPWRGLGRVVARVSRFVYDQDTAALRASHGARGETPEALKVHNMRRANLHARWLVAGMLLVPPAFLVMAWTYPRALSAVVAALVFVLIVKAIPGRGLEELGVAAAAGGATFFSLPYLLALIPVPPVWPFELLGVAAWLGLGWHGRPAGKKLGGGGKFSAPGALEKPTADLVAAALVAAVPGVTEKTRDSIRWHAPGVARDRGGYHLSGELPPGVTVSDVMENREEFAAALRRPMGCVWPGRGPMHPGHLHLFIGDEPMATAEQPRWPLADGPRVDIFTRLKLFTDQRGGWKEQLLAYQAIVIGGAPGYGKSFALREIGCAVALDPRTKVKCYDGKGNGDLRPLRLIADEFHEGDEPDEIRAQLASVQAVREEMRRRARFLRDLPAELNPEDKVTSALVDRYPDLAPIVLLFDEVQVYTEADDKDVREAFVAALADIVRRGRSAGIIPVFCTQKPSATVIPTIITDNCSVRLCFRVTGQKANDAVLGTEMHSSGIKATKFGPDDKGLAWLKGDGAEPLVVRTVFGLDKPTAEKLMAKARALRESLGLLTGYAAGEQAEAEDDQVRLLDDCREVLDEDGADRMHLVTLLDRLALLRPGIYGVMDVDGLGAALRGAGVPTGQVKVGGKNTTGVRRAGLDVAATDDADPADEDGVVVPIR